MEEWKDIEGYEGLYQVSNQGRVKSLERGILNNGGIQYKEDTILMTSKHESGHLCVGLSKDGVEKLYYIHRLVAKSFLPNPYNYNVVHHKDHDPTNNRVENLVWTTKGHHTTIHKAKIVYQYTLDNKLIAIWKTSHDAAETLGFNLSRISHCCNGGFYCKSRGKWVNCYQAYGYKWSYEPL